MKLFEAIFHLLEAQEEPLYLSDGTRISTWKDSEGTSHYDAWFDIYPIKTSALIESRMSRARIEEFLAYLILDHPESRGCISAFLYRIDDVPQNPFKDIRHEYNSSLTTILNNDHPEVVERVQNISDEEALMTAAVQLVAERITLQGASLTLIFDKENDHHIGPGEGGFELEEIDYLGQGTHTQILKDEAKLKDYLTSHGYPHYLMFKDGRLCGRAVEFAFTWLQEHHGIDSFRKYLLKKNL